MFKSPTVTARELFFSLCPLQVEQGVILIYVSYSALLDSENVSLYRRSTFSTSPSNVTS